MTLIEPVVPSSELTCPDPAGMIWPTPASGNRGIAEAQNRMWSGWTECHSVVDASRRATEAVENAD